MQKLSLSLVLNKSRRGERGFSVSNGLERAEAIPKREKGDDSKSDVIFFHHDSLTGSTIRADVGVAIVPQTISRHLAEANLKSKHPFCALPLTPEHRQLRLQWCQARSMRPGERYNPPLTVLRHTARTAGVMVRGAIAYDSQSTLIVMHGTLTGQRYVDDILRPHLGPFINGLPGAIFQQDNARTHTARVAQDFLRHFKTFS
ncbi:transposable element Tcb2 transposase [Trichonephila clavipes]|nr:transposable element Tcb2 transposase [Trichonephila clavipes]